MRARPRVRLHAAAVLVLAWAALLAAGWAVGEIVTSTAPAWDVSAVADLHGALHTELTAVMRATTWLGSPAVLDVVFAVAIVVLLVMRSWRNALFLVLASPGTVAMVQIIKPTVARARPLGLHLTRADGASWPSGHASSSTALYGGLLLVVLSTQLGTSRRTRRTAELLVAVLLVLIGISRVYLGVHYPSDVIAAWLIAAGWLTVLERTLGHPRPHVGQTEPRRTPIRGRL